MYSRDNIGNTSVKMTLNSWLIMKVRRPFPLCTKPWDYRGLVEVSFKQTQVIHSVLLTKMHHV